MGVLSSCEVEQLSCLRNGCFFKYLVTCQIIRSKRREREQMMRRAEEGRGREGE